MALVNKPDESIFASSAKQGEVDNFPDLLRGWGITFDQTQGIPPMEWFNFLFKRLDEKHTYLMQRGLPEWSATQDYTKGSCVQFDGVSYRALKNSKNNSPNESDSQYWVRWGFALSEIARATLTQYGVTQLYTGYDSQSEDLALTPKTGYQLKQLIDSNTRALGNVIPNSKKSSAVNSNSADTVATSAAVKTAYDKGVEAKTAADNAQRTANDGVSKATAAQISANQAKSAADAAQHTANDGVSKANAAQSSANAANNNANGRISKTDISHATNGTNKAKVASEFAVGELARSFTYQKIGDIEVRKYPDGTMIQTCRKHMLTGDYSKVNFNWAVAFTEMPILTATAQYYNSVGDHDTIITFVQGTSNSACHLVCGETYNNNGEIAYVNIIAIGRWKR